jgi:hypothetical protein
MVSNRKRSASMQALPVDSVHGALFIAQGLVTAGYIGDAEASVAQRNSAVFGRPRC